MLRLSAIVRRLRPRGLAARAAMFAVGLLLATAAATGVAILIGAEGESARQQLRVTANLTGHMAFMSRTAAAQRDPDTLTAIADMALSSNDICGFSVRDAQGALLAEQMEMESPPPGLARVAERVRLTGRAHSQRTPNGLVVSAPIMQDGRYVGAYTLIWRNNALRYHSTHALLPILLVILILALAAAVLTVRVVRKTVAPLEHLTRFAGHVAERGEAPGSLSIRTGDEIESLACAFNNMLTRLDQSMRRIQEIAFVDPATRLPNADRFMREVDACIAKTAPDKPAGAVAVFEFVRLNRLMQTLDASAARDLLREVAERLSQAVRSFERGRTPIALPARLGAHEFAVFAPAAVKPSDAARFALHVNTALNEPFAWRGHKLSLAASCGVALAPRDGRDADAVIRHARMALSVAHAAPKRLKVFTPALDRETVARMTLEREMRGALERNEFRAYFQPKVNIATGRIESCEALARWIRPDRTIISPGRFIPVAEEGGLIGALSEAIMREACWKAAAWARAGHPASVAVNVSASQFRGQRFAESVLRTVEHAGLEPSQLELELTESMVMEDVDRALKTIAPLREAGVRLAIDDFGCGHSNLAALSRLPFDVIKIDQQFVRALSRGDEQAPAIIEMILALARTLDLDVVAEGIERREDMLFMAQRGCHWVQGFLYGAAVSAREFAAMLREQPKLSAVAAA